MDTLLIVEDEPVLRASMVRGLAKLPGLEIVNAGTVADARALIAAMPPTMMISDLDLPDGSGLDLLAEIDRRELRIPVLFVSAYLRRFKVPQRSGVELLEKPVPLSRLRELVTRKLGGHTPSGAFGLADYVQLAGMGRRSVRLNLLRNGTRVGEVVIKEGEAWHAEDLRGEGPDAFVRLMCDSELLVEPESGERIDTAPRTLEGSCEHVLLESARRLDEANRDGESLGGDLESGWDDLAAPAAPVTITKPPPTREPEPVRVSAPRAARSESTFGAGGKLSRLSFDELYERGVEALLDKRYNDALTAFREAREIRTTPTLEANLHRLAVLGYGA